MHKFRFESKLSTYLTRVAINLSLNELKRRKRMFSLFSRSDDDYSFQLSDPSMSPERHDIQNAIEYGLKKLDPDFRSVIVLRLVQGYSVKETSDILGIPIGTVASRLARAQEKLTKIIKPHFSNH